VWDHIEGTHLHLQIAPLEGEPIRLPLLSDTKVTPRQADAQFNQIVPVLPFVALPGSKTVDDMGSELEIQVSETGNTYHDIDVARYRQQDGFVAGERKATGVALEDIWLPA
ncbi:hypothetical protein, partial [Pseudomonas syringae]|uniref:hypothetical protein n=1 Tax=Pseudomonas syringae TaxID=317 RepID=UPI000357D31A